VNGLFNMGMDSMQQLGQGALSTPAGGGASMVGGQSSPFSPILGDADFMKRSAGGEFDDWGTMTVEAQDGVMEYLNAPESHISSQQIGAKGMSSAEELGMSAYKDMSLANQATPLAGLMSMAQTGQRQQQYKPFQVQQGLMNPWGG
jgi:hypothetical protein